MIEATITYKDGTEESRDFSTWPAYAKFIDNHAGAIREADATDLHPTQRQTKTAKERSEKKDA